MTAVRILGLGAEGAGALAALERVLRAAWEPGGALDVRVATAGDDAQLALRTLRRWCDAEGVDVALTVGRAGHLALDFAPEIAGALIGRSLPGIEERMCLAPPVRPQDLLFRGRAGLRKATLVVNLPGRPARDAAVVRLLAPVFRHALEKARGDGGECGRPRGRR